MLNAVDLQGKTGRTRSNEEDTPLQMPACLLQTSINQAGSVEVCAKTICYLCGFD